MLRISALIAALLASGAFAACGSDDNSKTSGSGSPAGSADTTSTSTGKKGSKPSAKFPAPGKVTTTEVKTPQARAFVTRIGGRCAAAFAGTRSIAPPTGTVTSGRAYARRTAGPITRTIKVLRSSRPPKNQVAAVATLLGSYGETRPLLRTLIAKKGAQRTVAPTAAKQLPAALKRVRTYAAAARLRSCRPPGF